MWRDVLGSLGALVVAVSALYYLLDVLRGNTRPQRTSWALWATVGILGFGTSTAGGAGPGAWAVGVDAVACIVTFAVSLNPRFGKRGGSRFDPFLVLIGLAAHRPVALGDVEHGRRGARRRRLPAAGAVADTARGVAATGLRVGG